MRDKQIKASLAEAYNRHAEQRNKGGIPDWKVVERAHFLSLLQKENKKTLLEIGAGHGRDSVFFQMQGFEVTAIDLSPAMARLCRQKNVTASVMDMAEPGFAYNSFDSIYALNNFLHVPKAEFSVALENAYNLLRPTGLFYLGLYGGYDFEGIWDQDTYIPKRFFSFHTDEDLKRILGRTFESVYFKHIELGGDNRPFQSVILRKGIKK